MMQSTEDRTPLLTAARSCLLLVDVQQRLAPAIADGAQVIEHCVWLARLAGELGVPVVITEHMAQKIGPTAQPLREAAPSAQVAAKASFSAVRGGCLDVTSVRDREQIVVAGMEAHVCVLQSAIDLQAQGKSVHVVAEACGSRRARDVELALARMRQHGVQIVSREMVAFEWLQGGDDPRFGEVLRRYIR
jgi:nicotinamidase-related amidase